jgi:hypothetical protein
MAQKMMRFDTFHEWQRIMEDSDSNIELLSLNEAFSSDYLRKFSGQESGIDGQINLQKISISFRVFL